MSSQSTEVSHSNGHVNSLNAEHDIEMPKGAAASVELEQSFEGLISWSSVLAATIIAVVASVALGLLGVSIGLSTIHIPTQSRPFAGLTTMAGIWYAIVSLCTLFVGGMLAARLSGRSSFFSGAAHGLVTWAVITILTIYSFSMGVGSVVGGAFGVFSQAIQSTSDFALGGVSASRGMASGLMAYDNQLQTLKQEAFAFLQDTGKPALQPEKLQKDAESVTAAVTDAGQAIAKDPSDARMELESLMDRLSSKADKVLTAVDQQAAVEILVANTSLNASEARRVVDRWSTQLQASYKRLQALGVSMIDSTERIAQSGIDSLSSSAFWAFLSLLAGALAACIGGVLGSEEHFRSIVRVSKSLNT